MSLFDKTKNKINNYIGSVDSDINSIEKQIERWRGDFGTGKNLSNLFDQRISDGLSDLISGATGIRTSNIPAIREDILTAKEANRQARQEKLSAKASGIAFEKPEDREVLRYPQIMHDGENISGKDNAAYIHFSTIPRRHKLAKANPDQKNEHYDIFLHLPNEIQDNLQVQYKEAEASVIGQIITGFFGATQGMDAYQWNWEELWPELMKMVPGHDIAAQAMGQVTNPMKYQLFEGVNFRTYTYNFTLRPKNAQESQTIRHMIHIFKKMALPGTQGPNRRIYTLPNEWSITYDGIVQDWLDFPLTSVITGVEVDHTGGQGYVATIDGASTAVNLALTFTETVPLYRDRYAEEVSAYSASQGERNSTNHLTTDIKGPDDIKTPKKVDPSKMPHRFP